MKRVCNCAKRWKSEPDEQKIHKAIIYHRPVCYLHDDNFISYHNTSFHHPKIFGLVS